MHLLELLFFEIIFFTSAILSLSKLPLQAVRFLSCLKFSDILQFALIVSI